MRFTLDRHPTANLVTGIEPGAVRIGEEVFRQSFILSAQRIIPDWPVASSENVTLAGLQPALELRPDILLLGTGARLVFPPGPLVAELATRGVGLEIMDTAAACRTYNILVNEDRPVVAALILG